MKTRSKLAGASALFLLMTGTALAQNPGMMNAPFPRSNWSEHAPRVAQSKAQHRQADNARVSHSMIQTGQRHKNS
jgi:hypothetical protein